MVEGLTDAQIIERIERMQNQIRALYDHLGLEFDDPAAGLSHQVMALVKAGDKMGAAAQLSKETGASFPDAQKTINAL